MEESHQEYSETDRTLPPIGNHKNNSLFATHPPNYNFIEKEKTSSPRRTHSNQVLPNQEEAGQEFEADDAWFTSR